MRSVLTIVLLGILASVLSFASTFSMTESITMSDYDDISAEEAYELINTTDNLFILDVRTLEEHEQGFIENATLIPVSELETRADELPTDYQTPILVYCAIGGRSATASQTLASLGYTQVYNLLGGFNAWKDAGYPYTTDSSSEETSSNGNSDGKESSTVEKTPESLLFILLGLAALTRLKRVLNN